MKSNLKTAVAGVVTSLSLLASPMALAEYPSEMYHAELEIMKAMRAGQQPAAPVLPDAGAQPDVAQEPAAGEEPAVTEQPAAAETESKWDSSIFKPIYT